MKAKMFKLTLITNLHMGSGETNFNFIDNQVQRDPITSYPNMHASGIKGALREHFDNLEDIEASFVTEIFGSENGVDNSQQGALSFIEGKLLAIPVRSNKKSYYLGTTKELIKTYLDFAKLLGKEIEDIDLNELNFDSKKIIFLNNEENNLMIEGIESKEIKFIKNNELKESLERVLGIKDIVIFEEEFFKNDIAAKLPVIPRNKLNNGKSENLWYEEVVPRESVFYTAIIDSQNKTDKFEKLAEELEKNLVQIGANATIGYGFTKISEVK